MSTPTRAPGRGLAFFVVLLLLVSSTSRADPPPPPPLTLEAALSMARQNNRLAAAARLRIGEARGDLTGASVLLVDNPEARSRAVNTNPRPMLFSPIAYLRFPAFSISFASRLR